MNLSARMYILMSFLMVTPIVSIAQNTSEHIDSIVKTLNLKEVVVKAKKIRQSGDTITYNASSYMDKQDKVLEDLLRKMPGIEVASDGQIKFNGQWVNELYIEGSNLLDNNYGIATKNLDVNAIGSVQVMENHQDVKLLQGIKKGDAPAINIRLKQTAKGVWSSILSLGVGSQKQLSRDASVSLMNFRRKSQNIILYKTNDVGTDLRQEINAPSSLNSSLGTGVVLPNKPILSNVYSYRNSSHLGSINRLFKLNENETLTCNLNYLYDKEKQDANDETTYLKSDGNHQLINESNRAVLSQNFVNGNVLYKLNSSKIYLKNKLTVNVSLPHNNGIVNDCMAQKLTGHNVTIENSLVANLKNKRESVSDGKLNLSFYDKKGFLSVPFIALNQEVRQQKFAADATASVLSLSIPYFMFNINGCFDFNWQKILTNLDSQSEINCNDQKTMQTGTRVNFKFFIHDGHRLQWLVYVPVGVSFFNMNCEENSYKKTFFSLKPYSNLTYKVTDNLAMDFTAICEESLPNALSLLVQKRYKNYRMTQSNSNMIEVGQDRSLKLSIGSRYKDVVKMFFGGINLSYLYTKSHNSFGYDIVGDMVNYAYCPMPTTSRVWQISQNASKGFFRWNSKLSESFSYGTSKNEYVVGGSLRNGRTDYLQANISYTASFAKWLSLTMENDYFQSKPYVDGKSRGIIYRNFENTTSVSFSPIRQLSVMPSVQFFHNNYFDEGRNNTFLNCLLEYYIGSTTLSLKCNNLLDSDVFHRVTDNGVTRYVSKYKLRGRTLMIGVRFKLL